MPTLSQYNILSRLRNKIIVSQALASQVDNDAAGLEPETELQDQGDELRPLIASSDCGEAESTEATQEGPSDDPDIATRVDTPREPRVKSAKLTSFAESCKMIAVPEVETSEVTEDSTLTLSTTSISQPEDISKSETQDNEIVPTLDENTPTAQTATNHNREETNHNRDASIRFGTPAKPCLKRSDSCFIRRPESRSKSVTFERPFSVFTDCSRRSLVGSQGDISLPYIHGVSSKSQSENDDSDSGDDEVFGPDSDSASPADTNHKKGLWRRHRPSSCGPSFQRVVQAYSTPQRLEAERQSRAQLNRRPSLDNLPLLPKFSFGGFFSVRRGSLINRTLFSGGEHSSRWFRDSPDRKDFLLEQYETYIIRNCRLIRRDRPSAQYSLLDSPKDVKKRFDFSDPRNDSVVDELEIEEGESARKVKGDTETSSNQVTKGSYSDDSEFRDRETPGLRVNPTEIHRWSNEKQAIIVERPTSASEMATNGLIVQKATTWKEEVLKIPEDKKEELLKLGFRKPAKIKKKRKSEKKKTHEANIVPQRIEINLKEDPLLIKVSKKNKNVGHFLEKPQSQPNAVCFEIYGSSQSHLEVKQQIERLLKTCPEVKLVSIKFDHRTIYNNSKEMYNRWIITTNSVLGRNRLAGCELVFDDQIVQLRRYDDVISGEYQQFTRMQNFVKMMNNRKILGKGATDKNVS